METKTLLESGTNELEILEFKVDNNLYGINVAKIKEIIGYLEPTPVPNSHKSIEGVFMPRDTMITAIDLKNCLQRGDSEKGGLFIVTNFNKLDIAFHVEQVIGIHRLAWTQIIPPTAAVSSADRSVASGLVKINDKLIVILDFEKIVTDIAPETGLKLSEVKEVSDEARCKVPVLIVEDSPLLNQLIEGSLRKAGYDNITHKANGQEAYDFLLEELNKGTLKDYVQCIITDIEMPQMDGHRLTYLVKNNEQLSHLPIVIFSSLVNEEMKKKGESLGANAQLSKPEIGKLVDTINELVNN